MKQGLIVAVGGVAIVAAALSGCSGDKEKSGSEKGSTASAGASATSSAVTASAGGSSMSTGGSAKVTVDGQEQKVEGAVVCTETGGNESIVVGNSGQGVVVMVSSGDSPTVQSVSLGHVNGAMLGYQQGAPGGQATATKDGKTYKVSGTASGADMSNPAAGMVTKPFEIEVTCP